jgi:hypothetical protein
VCAETVDNLLHSLLSLALISGAAMHLVLRHLTPVFCEITFDGMEPANIVLGFHGGGDHFLKVRGILGYCRGEWGVIKGSTAETVGQQTSHWMLRISERSVTRLDLRDGFEGHRIKC